MFPEEKRYTEMLEKVRNFMKQSSGESLDSIQKRLSVNKGVLGNSVSIRYSGENENRAEFSFNEISRFSYEVCRNKNRCSFRTIITSARWNFGCDFGAIDASVTEYLIDKRN